jgi:hypothetical protein
LPKIIPVEQRAVEAREAWKLYTSGVPKTEIAERLSRNRRTVDILLQEASLWYESDDMEFKRRALVQGHRQVLRMALEGAEQLHPKSPARAAHLMQANEALKAIGRLEGAIVHRMESKHSELHMSLADLVQEHERRRGRATDVVIEAEDDLALEGK